MATQCCTSRIFAVKWGTFLNALFLSYPWENRHKSYITAKIDSLSYISVAGNVGLSHHGDVIGSQSYQIRLNNAKSQNNSHYAIQGHSGSFQLTNFGTNGKLVCVFLCVNITDFNLPPILHICEIWRIICLIIAVCRGHLSLMHSLGSNPPPEFRATKFGHKKPETSLYRTVWSVFRKLKLFRRDSRVWLSDGRRDRWTFW